jgi:hypothetical protein
MDESIKEEYMIWDRPLQFSVNANFYVEKNKPLFGFGRGVLDDYNLYFRIFYQSGKRYTPYIFTGQYLEDGRPVYSINRKNRNGAIGKDWFWVDMNFEKFFTLSGFKFSIRIEVNNLFDFKNSAIINPVTGKAYEYGDPTPLSWNDPLYPSYQAPLDPYPYNPARYLTRRNVKAGITVRF